MIQSFFHSPAPVSCLCSLSWFNYLRSVGWTVSDHVLWSSSPRLCNFIQSLEQCGESLFVIDCTGYINKGMWCPRSNCVPYNSEEAANYIDGQANTCVSAKMKEGVLQCSLKSYLFGTQVFPGFLKVEAECNVANYGSRITRPTLLIRVHVHVNILLFCSLLFH
jgi:hypothetical protein